MGDLQTGAAPQAWQERTALLIGQDGIERLRQAHILIAGLGGVGGWAAEMLARAGIGQMTIVDADDVVPSNINRQSIALHSTIGAPKVELIRNRLLDINPNICIHPHRLFLKDELMINLLDASPYSFVVDAIDSLSPKVYLIALAAQRGIPIVSSMGAGAKRDAAAIRVDDISRSHNCTLARAVRKRLRPLGVRRDVAVVYSVELPDRDAVIAIEGEPCKRSTAGTLSYMPALFGIRAAAYVIDTLLADGSACDHCQ